MNNLLNILLSNEFKIAIASGLLVPLIIWLAVKFYRKYFVKPKLVLEYKVSKGINSPEYRSPIENNGDYYSEDCKMIYKQELKLEVIIHNNSRMDAYSPKLEVLNKPHKFELALSKLSQVILANTTVTLEGKYSFLYERLSRERNKNVAYPLEFTNMSFRLRYKNEDGGRFTVKLKINASINQ